MHLSKTHKAQNLAERFTRQVREYFRSITMPGINPTSNLTEHAIRFEPIHRRMTHPVRTIISFLGANQNRKPQHHVKRAAACWQAMRTVGCDWTAEKRHSDAPDLK